jgi:hypothetical protein
MVLGLLVGWRKGAMDLGVRCVHLGGPPRPPAT